MQQSFLAMLIGWDPSVLDTCRRDLNWSLMHMIYVLMKKVTFDVKFLFKEVVQNQSPLNLKIPHELGYSNVRHLFSIHRSRTQEEALMVPRNDVPPGPTNLDSLTLVFGWLLSDNIKKTLDVTTHFFY